MKFRKPLKPLQNPLKGIIGGYPTNENSNRIDHAVDVWAYRGDSDDVSDKMEDYHRHILRKWIFIIACIVGVVIVAGFALTIGDFSISFSDVYGFIWKHITGTIDANSVYEVRADYAIWDLRLPRICTGIIAGIALGAAGAVMQSILRNPLADPYTTGISSGASFGASLAMGVGITVAGMGYAIVINAFVFALIPMVIIMLVSKLRGASPTTMVMAGIAVMYIFNAMTTLIKLWSDADTLAMIYAWSVGSIDGVDWDEVMIMLPIVIVGVAVLMLISKHLNVRSTGDETAKAMGVNAGRLRIIALLVVSLISAAVVSFTGLIGFIGLVCPHIARLVIGSDNRYLIPASAAFGAVLLLVADCVGRLIISGTTIQVGVITAFIGAPLFLYLIVKQRKEAWE